MSKQPEQAAFVPSGFFVLRTPLLPFDLFQGWSAELTAVADHHDAAQLTAALPVDQQRLRTRLRDVVDQPAVREAIFVASPDLERALDQWRQAPESPRGQKVEPALVRYLARMAGRATPFGLFAGCAVGTLGDRTQLTIAAQSCYQRHTRLDMDYLFTLAERLSQEPTLQPDLCYRPNSSLYQVGEQLRFAEARHRDHARAYQLTAVTVNPYVQAALTRARAGAQPATLAATLVDADPTVSQSEAVAFVSELIDSQLLVPELAPTVSGPEPIHRMIDQLHGAPAAPAVAAQLAQVRQALAALDEAGLGQAPYRYQAIADQLVALPANVTLGRLFQVDLVKPAPTATLGRAVLAEIERGVALLHRLFAPATDGLESFRQAFATRYGDQAVPLVQVLDAENGLAFAASPGPTATAPLLQGLYFPGNPTEPTTPWGAQQALLLQKLAAIWQQGTQTLELTAADLGGLPTPARLPLPNAFTVVATVAAASQAALDTGDFRLLLHNLSGPSGARLLGRFCHADPTLQRQVEAHLRAEEQLEPTAIFAEVIHLPEGRIGNVICRPVLRSHEIPFLGVSGACPERQIPITDLLVSLEAGELVLRSRRLGRRIIPRLTSAHNYTGKGLALYQFLGALQGQGVATGVSWQWGPLESAAFLPRVTSGKLVLARARWRVDAATIQQLTQSTAPARFAAVQQWRQAARLPRYIVLADGDHELPVDLDNGLSVESFVDLLKGRQLAKVVEFFPPPDQLCATGPEGRFVHELVVPFVRQPAALPAAAPQGSAVMLQAVVNPRHPRTFAPGSAWLYAKLYTGPATADQVLQEVVAPLRAAALHAGAADQWFFLRYGDPDWHLRLRLHGAPARLTAEISPLLNQLTAPLLADGRLWRVQLDTYERELERYGGDAGILPSEQLFYIDSEATLAIIGLQPGDAGATLRWQLALAGLDALLTDFGYDLAAKLTLVSHLRARFAIEFALDQTYRRQIGEKYRQLRPQLATLFAPIGQPGSALAAGWHILQQRSRQLAPVVATLRAQAAAGHVALDELVASYLHMQVNRLLRSAQREQELVLYELLIRHYQAQRAQGKSVADQA